MNKTKQMARELFYTGKTTMTPTEDEEIELQQKYGRSSRRTFNDEIDDIMKYAEEDSSYLSSDGDTLEDQAKELQIEVQKYAKNLVANIFDKLEDDYNLDINNLDPHKYRRLNERFEVIKKSVWRQIMLSKLDDRIKQFLARNIEKTEDISQLLIELLFYINP